jgi:hypothetical protein
MRPAFRAYMSGNAIAVTGDATAYVVAFDTKDYDEATVYNASTFRFTAPTYGRYMIGANVSFGNLAAAHTECEMYARKNGGTYYQLWDANGGAMRDGNNNCVMQGQIPLLLSPGDYIEIVVVAHNSTKTVNVGGGSGITFFWVSPFW